MADGTTINPGIGGDTIATDDLTSLNGVPISGQKAERVKIGFGPDSTLTDVTSSNPLPVVLQPAAIATTFADTGVITASNYRGITIKNTSSSTSAEVAVRQTNISGILLDTIVLGPSESVREDYPGGRATGGVVYMQLVSGAVSGSVFTA